jgi:hypothetical protein
MEGNIGKSGGKGMQLAGSVNRYRKISESSPGRKLNELRNSAPSSIFNSKLTQNEEEDPKMKEKQ